MSELMEMNLTDTCGIDYVSMTTSSYRSSEDFSHVLKALELGLQDEGFVTKTWRMVGYTGWRTGPLAYGVRLGDQTYARWSGPRSIWLLRYVDMPVKVTRIDLQVTHRLHRPDPDLAKSMYERVNALADGGNLPFKASLIRSGDGDTLYLNSRSGPRFLRMYDKSPAFEGAEKGEVWRWEVEYKRGAVYPALDRIYDPETGFLDYLTIADLVYSEFVKKGALIPKQGYTTVDLPKIEPKHVTIDGRLEWLARCVRPVLTELAGAGYGEEALDALHIPSDALDVNDLTNWE